jgi:hypothetical protein
MTQKSKLKQPNGDDNRSNGPEDVGSQPSKPDAKELVVQPEKKLPALEALHEPEAALIAAQLSQSMNLPRGLDPAAVQMFRNSNIVLYARLDSQDAHESVLNRLLVPKAADLFLRNAMRGGLVAAELVKAIDNHRGQRQNNVTVGQVNVHSGGQAIVGNVLPKDGEDQAGDPPLTTSRSCITKGDGNSRKTNRASDAD